MTFTLRPGLTFTDGTPLDAQAVKENIERGQTQSNSNIASELAVISKVVVNSPTSFTLDLAQVDYQVPVPAGRQGRHDGEPDRVRQEPRAACPPSRSARGRSS